MAGLNVLAFQYFWYWRFAWFDILMHGLGGVAIAMFTGAILYTRPLILRTYGLVTLSVLAALVSGVAWEVFEFALDRYDLTDTTIDLLLAMVGALVGARVFNYFYRHVA